VKDNVRRFAAVLILLVASFSLASDAVDLQATVIAPDGKPVAGADVWLVTHKQSRIPYDTAAHAMTDAAGRFTFGKELIDKLWKDSVYPQVVARDRDGHLGSLYMIYPGLRTVGDSIKLRAVGEVSGQILDGDGRPIADVQITPQQFGRMIVERQFVEPIYLPPVLAKGHTTKSDSDGSFTIRGVPIGARLKADIVADGHARVTIDWDTATPLALRLPRPATVTGRLIGASETDRAGKSLTLVTADLPHQIGPRGPLIVSFDHDQKTDRGGAFRFDGVPPGRYTLKASENKIGASYLEESEVRVEPGRDPSAIVLNLKPSRMLRGRVVDVTGAGVAGVSISLCRFQNPGGPFGRQLVATDSACVSGSDGAYEGYVIVDGEVGARIDSLPEGYARKDAGEVVALKDPQAPLAPLIVQKIEPLIVHVLDSQGKPVAGAKIDVTGAARFLPNGPPKPSGADGIVKLPLADRSENATLRVIAGDAVSEPLTINPDDERGPLTMVVSAANAFRLIGQVVDRRDKPVIGARVQVMSMVSYRSKRQPILAGSGAQRATLTTDADGRFAAGPFVPGDQYSLSIKSDGYRTADSAEIAATKGTTHDFGRIVLTRIDAVVRGSVVGSGGSPLAGARVVNSGDAPTRLVTTAAADGSFELRELASGMVHVVAFKDDFLPARAAIDTDNPAAAKITMRRRGEPSSELPPVGIDDAAVRAAAKQVLEKLWEWPEARKSPVDKKLIELMARLDPEQARRWAGKTSPDELTIDQLAESDLDEALAQLATRDPYPACRELKRLAEKYRQKDPTKALRFMEEMAVRSRAVDPVYRLFSMSDAGRLLAQLGKPEAGRKLVEEAAAQAEKLSSSLEWDRYVRGYVAGRLAPFDLPRAKKLFEASTIPRDRSRYAAMCANALAATNPDDAREMLYMAEKGFERGRYAATVAYLMAPNHTETAVRIAEECGEGGNYTALGLAWAALAVAPQNKPESHRLIDRAFRAIHDRSPNASDSGSWGETAGTVALAAFTIDYPNRVALAAHVFAERPTQQDVQSDVRAVEANITLAILLAPADRAAARSLLDAAELRKDLVGSGGQNVRRREYLIAWGLIDPKYATPLLISEIERLKGSPQLFTERCDLLDALGFLTTPPADRPRALGRSHWTGWPSLEDIE
jgi:uncharacterized GH25 family protein